MTVTTLAVIITVVLALAATGVYAYATRDLGRHVADPITAQEYAARARERHHEENGYGDGFFPAPPPQTHKPLGVPYRAGVEAGAYQEKRGPQSLEDETSEPGVMGTLEEGAGGGQGQYLAATPPQTSPAGRTPLASQATPVAGTRPAPVTWTSSEHLAAEVWATRPWADDTGSFEAIAAGWS